MAGGTAAAVVARVVALVATGRRWKRCNRWLVMHRWQAAAAQAAIPPGRVETRAAALLVAPAVAVAARAAAATPGLVDRLPPPAVANPPVVLAVSASLAGRPECCQSSAVRGPRQPAQEKTALPWRVTGVAPRVQLVST